ncbi:MAG: DUF4365 domain-containing protein [Methanosarcinaceae archaeon]|nr:DUF4365 domain-containing protein [Methanosarcinaceae archaeon]
MSLTREHRQEDLSIAYISAVAAKAGYNCGRPGGHDYGIDVEIRTVEKIRNKRRDTGYTLNIQAKASYNFQLSDDERWVIYDLNVDTYNMLVEKRGTPTILILYCMPSNEDEWVSICEEYTTLKRCGYWVSLEGMGFSLNSSKQRIKIPREQMFTELALKSIMSSIESGGSL